MNAVARRCLFACLLVVAPAAFAQSGTAPGAAPGLEPAQGTTIRRLKAGATEFAVRVRPNSAGPPRGALILVPGDGAYPFASRAIAALERGMGAFGWSTWLPELESPPRTHAAPLQDAAPAQAPAVVTQPEQPAAAAASGTAAQAATKPERAGSTSAEPASLEGTRAQELADWATRNRARLAAVVAAAAGEGRVVVAAEGAGAALLTGLAADTPNSTFAMALLYPVELPGLPADWPAGMSTPVLEVFDPADQPTQGTARRTHAGSTGAHHYRQAVLPAATREIAGGETPLVHRVRGWLRALEPEAAR